MLRVRQGDVLKLCAKRSHIDGVGLQSRRSLALLKRFWSSTSRLDGSALRPSWQPTQA